MSSTPSLPALLQRFFTERLMAQRQVSAHTMASYRDTFRLLLRFAQSERHKCPSDLDIVDLDADLIGQFLKSLEEQRHCCARTRNARLTAIRSFFHFASYQEPALSAHIQRVLAVPYKRQSRPIVGFLSHAEIEQLLATPDRTTWLGRREPCLARAGRPDRPSVVRADQSRAHVRGVWHRRSRSLPRQGTQGALHAADRLHACSAKGVAEGAVPGGQQHSLPEP